MIKKLKKSTLVYLFILLLLQGCNVPQNPNWQRGGLFAVRRVPVYNDFVADGGLKSHNSSGGKKALLVRARHDLFNEELPSKKMLSSMEREKAMQDVELSGGEMEEED